VNLRLLLLPLLLVVTCSFAASTGEYQKTRDGKTLVWNATPRAGDEARWFGDRDGEGYATGAGTLTWFTAKGTVYARYFGHMVHGKFTGPVNAHARGKTAHATFTDGERISRWTAGPASSRPEAEATAMVAELKPKPEASPADEAQPKVASPPPIPVQRQRQTEPQPQASAQAVTAMSTPSPSPLPSQQVESPAEGPPVKPAVAAATAEPSNPLPAPKAPRASAKDKTKASFDPSLTALVGPPSSLHTIPQNTQLTQQDVIDLADAEARVQGYELSEFERPKADYSATTGKWRLFYQQKSVDGAPPAGKHFIATVEDQTRKTTVERKTDSSE
jgi:hypothetical protein